MLPDCFRDGPVIASRGYQMKQIDNHTWGKYPKEDRKLGEAKI